MSKKRLLAALFLPLVLVTFLQSQSLAELAKKEKARRAALKGKTATVITTADLAKVKLRPAVESAAQEEVAEEAVAEGQEGVTPPATVAGAEAAGTAVVTQKPAGEAPPADAAALSDKDFVARQAELMKAVEERQDMVDLLTLKLNALYQEFNNLDTMKSREFIQGQIGETYDKLLKAEAEAKKAAKELDDFNATAKRQSAPAIWIR
jgi:hypothetical protein